MHFRHMHPRPHLARGLALAAWVAISASAASASPLTALARPSALSLPQAPADWQASTTSTGPKSPGAKPRKVKAPKMPPPSQAGSAETRAERDQRLRRECRGKPNAGACEGYAS